MLTQTSVCKCVHDISVQTCQWPTLWWWWMKTRRWLAGIGLLLCCQWLHFSSWCRVVLSLWRWWLVRGTSPLSTALALLLTFRLQSTSKLNSLYHSDKAHIQNTGRWDQSSPIKKNAFVIFYHCDAHYYVIIPHNTSVSMIGHLELAIGMLMSHGMIYKNLAMRSDFSQMPPSTYGFDCEQI